MADYDKLIDLDRLSAFKNSCDSEYQQTLVSGTNIRTVNGNSLLGSGNVAVQPTLVSGTNIKTINGNSLLGSGDITISSGGSGVTYTATTTTLAVAGWSNNVQTVSMSAVSATNDIIVAPAPASISAWAAAGVYCSAQGAGTLTFTCSTTPTAALTANVMIFESATAQASGVSF